MKSVYRKIILIVLALVILRFIDLKLNAPVYMKIYMALSKKNISEGNYNQAIKDLHIAAKMNPSSSLPYYQLGLIYEKLNDYENKIKFFKKTVELGSSIEYMKRLPYDRRDADYAHACYDVGMDYLKNNDVPMAIRMFELSLNHETVSIQSSFQLGLIFSKLNQEDKAMFYLAHLRRNPIDYELAQELETILYQEHPDWQKKQHPSQHPSN